KAQGAEAGGLRRRRVDRGRAVWSRTHRRRRTRGLYAARTLLPPLTLGRPRRQQRLQSAAGSAVNRKTRNTFEKSSVHTRYALSAATRFQPGPKRFRAALSSASTTQCAAHCPSFLSELRSLREKQTIGFGPSATTFARIGTRSM